MKTSPRVMATLTAVLLGLVTLSLDSGAASSLLIPEPLSIPSPGPSTDQPYAPQPILPGGIVIPL